MSLSDKLRKARQRPAEAVRVTSGILRGHLIRARYKLTHPNVEIGPGFRAYGWLHISGRGRVRIGRNVSIDISFLRPVHIVTHRADARVEIGDGTYLGGTRISAVDGVALGAESRFGSCTIIDSDIIPPRGAEIDDAWKSRHARPVRAGDHVWAGTNSYLLYGAQLGEECVLGAGAVALGEEFPPRSILLGNPGRVVAATRAS